MKVYAVIDTNVIVSALLSKNEGSATVRVLNEIFGGRIIPLYHQDILREYKEVLYRSKFHLEKETIEFVLDAIVQFGLSVFPHYTGEKLIDEDDVIFYEVVMEKRDEDAYLVTGNQKHFPAKEFIVTPAEMMEILDGNIES